ncbi:uncharacterized protein DSM5745_07979 [Aspergillus mulundensis]|uniref:Uncharacterized protein n=1 Tax=Aspergillus mulundensis TaxID=1810919 RepID=A0A3D8R988_9EURO|nr:hypothetical protein DSM5745_07979 [Aspergillus mulundensis]RDW70468.1 hypothetical protein DSM5745_07979 [Aspergillus mulundensis]
MPKLDKITKPKSRSRAKETRTCERGSSDEEGDKEDRNWNYEVHWELSQSERPRVPEELTEILRDYNHEAEDLEPCVLARLKLDAILMSTLAAVKRTGNGCKSTQTAHFVLGAPISLPWEMYCGMRTIRGEMDDSMAWERRRCKDRDRDRDTHGLHAGRIGPGLPSIRSRFKCVRLLEACVNWLCRVMLHHARKKAGHAAVPIYGVSTDSVEWFFLRLSPENTLSAHCVE